MTKAIVVQTSRFESASGDCLLSQEMEMQQSIEGQGNNTQGG